MMIHPVAVVVPKDNRDNLTQMMNDVQELAAHAKRLLAELEVSMDGTSARLTDVTNKAETLRKGKLKTALDNLHGKDAVEYVRSVQEKKFKPTKTLATSIPDIFKEESRPFEAIVQRNACWDSPDFSIFEKLSPGCSLKFSNPGFFYQEWSRVQMKEYDEAERKMNEEKEAKKRNKERKKKELESSILSTGSDTKSIPGSQPPPRRTPRPPTQSNMPIPMQPQQVGAAVEPQAKRPPRPHSMAQPQSTTPPEVTSGLGARRVSRPPTTIVQSGAPARPTRTDAPSRPVRTGAMAVTSSTSASNIFDQPPRPAAPQRVPSASPTATTMQPPPPVPRPGRPLTPQGTVGGNMEASRTSPPPPPPGARPAPAPPTGTLSPRSASSASSYETAAAGTPSPPNQTAAPAMPAPPRQPPLVDTTIRATRQRPPPPAPPAPRAVVTTPSMQASASGTQSPVKSVSDPALLRTKRAQAPAPPPPSMQTYVTTSTSFQPAVEEEDYASPAKRAPPVPPVVPAIQTTFEEEDESAEVTPPSAHLQQYQQPEAIEEPQESLTAPVVEEVRNPLLDDPVLKKFAMMQKMNLPQGAIEQAMIRAKVDPALLFGDAAMSRLTTPPVKIVIPPRLDAEPTAAAAPAAAARPKRSAAGGSIMDELLQGKVLRKVESSSSSPRPAPTSVSSELMQGILDGRNKLKKVEVAPAEAKKPMASNLDSGGVASILARRIAIVGDKGSDTDSAGSEWDDSDDD